jgi:hypothetical protein
MHINNVFGLVPCVWVVLRPESPELVGAAASIPSIEKNGRHIQGGAHNVNDTKLGPEGFNHVAVLSAFLRQDQSQLLAAEHLLAPPLVNEDLSVQLVLALNRGLFET